VRAVIFDLWDTLVEWPVEPAAALREAIREHTGLSEEEFHERWESNYRVSQTGTLARFYREVGVPEEWIETHVKARLEFARDALHAREDVARTLDELRRREIKIGLITMCSEDVPLVWSGTDLAGRFDVETFSATSGLAKPDREIYLTTAAALGVAPEECFFVGDGANDELAGAARAGMTPVLFAPNGLDVRWPEVREWQGLRVSSIPEVLELC
jgi:putative hydrolase of the HAD superfamily